MRSCETALRSYFAGALILKTAEAKRLFSTGETSRAPIFA